MKEKIKKIVSTLLAVALVSGIVPWDKLNFSLATHAQEISLSEESDIIEKTPQAEKMQESPAASLEEREEEPDFDDPTPSSEQNSDISSPTSLKDLLAGTLNGAAYATFCSGVLLALFNYICIFVFGYFLDSYAIDLLPESVTSSRAFNNAMLYSVFGFLLLPFIPFILLGTIVDIF